MQKSEEQPVRDRLSTPIQYVKGVGPKLSALLERKGIRTVEDALYFLPRAYEDRRHLKKVSELEAGRRETGFAEVLLSGFAFYSVPEKESLRGGDWGWERYDHVEVVSWQREVSQGAI